MKRSQEKDELRENLSASLARPPQPNLIKAAGPETVVPKVLDSSRRDANELPILSKQAGNQALP